MSSISSNSEKLNASKELMSLNHFGLVKVSGEKAEAFLQGQLTSDIRQITQDRCGLTALCNYQGRVLSVFFIFKRAQDYFCVLPLSIIEPFISHLTKYALLSKVSLENVSPSYYLYGYVGSNYQEVVGPFFQTLPHHPFEVKTDSLGLLCQLPGIVPRFLMCLTQPLSHRIALDDYAWKLSNILSGYPVIYPQTIGKVTPHMLNLHQLDDAISFKKGCYVGQEIIARTHYLGRNKRILCQAEISSQEPPAPGEPIYANDQEVGMIVDALKVDETVMALCVLKEPTAEDEYQVREGKFLSTFIGSC